MPNTASKINPLNSIKLLCPSCGHASAPVGPRTFHCADCSYHANFIVTGGAAKFFKAGRPRSGETKKGVSGIREYPGVMEKLREAGKTKQQVWDAGVDVTLRPGSTPS